MKLISAFIVLNFVMSCSFQKTKRVSLDKRKGIVLSADTFQNSNLGALKSNKKVEFYRYKDEVPAGIKMSYLIYPNACTPGIATTEPKKSMVKLFDPRSYKPEKKEYPFYYIELEHDVVEPAGCELSFFTEPVKTFVIESTDRKSFVTLFIPKSMEVRRQVSN